jgi:hypothetical protein
LKDTENSILGTLATHHEFALEELQRDSWTAQIKILKERLSALNRGHIFFEYSIPRMGRRVDVVLLLNDTVFVIEFKVGANQYEKYAIDQALDYSLDLKNFHEQSHNKKIAPIVVATEAADSNNTLYQFEDSVLSPLRANKHNLLDVILLVPLGTSSNIDPSEWEESIYKPTPTIIEAAQALYKGHSVKEISRADSDTINLSKTSDTISKIIDESKLKNNKSICFITGVPGAGKTLAGLNIANERHNIDEGEHAVFLSGNGPLVMILQEALARNEVNEKKGSSGATTKSKALSKTKAFIQNIHHFRDDSLLTDKAPIERVAVFDEAQRAWTLEQTRSFMKTKKGIQDFNMSEPEFLISVMDRHDDWSIIICLIGGGQEINTGEAGLPEWFSSIQKYYPRWKVYISDKLNDQEYMRGNDLFSMITRERLFVQRELHLSVSIRSYRSEKVSALVKSILDCDSSEAKKLYLETKNDYPILLTRNLEHAKNWLRSKARGTERCGIIASSGAYRLKPYGIHIKSKIDPINWFLNGKEDVRSSCFLEDVATEFDIQGLELDWICVAWDANFRYKDGQWGYKNFRGTSWQNINDKTRTLYLKNAYRVLLTRARQGMIIFIPEGDDTDTTRMQSFYDTTYNFLESIGMPCV